MIVHCLYFCLQHKCDSEELNYNGTDPWYNYSGDMLQYLFQNVLLITTHPFTS